MKLQLYVGNLSSSTTQADLETMFAAHGAVDEVKIPMDRETGRPRNFAFVTMSTPESAQAAIDALNGSPMGEGSLIVDEAKPRAQTFGNRKSGAFRPNRY